MNDEQKEWYRKYTASFGVREFFRFGCAFIIWMFFGIALTFISRSSIFLTLFLIIPFIFAIIAPRWKPAYFLFRKILGNENLPLESMPQSTVKISREPRPWWLYLPGIWFLLLELVIMYIILKER